MYLTAAGVIATAVLLVTYILNKIRENRRHVARARDLGCQPPIWTSSIDPSGIIELIYGLRASRQKQFPVYFQSLFENETQKHGRPIATMRLINPLFREVMITDDPRNIQAMLAVQFDDFELGPNRILNTAPLLGNGIFAANGKQWEHSRALLRPQFNRGQVSDLKLQEVHVRALMIVLERSAGSDGWTGLVDLQILFFRLTLDSATEFLFGESVNSQSEDLNNSDSRNVNFVHAFDRAQLILSLSTRLGPHYWMAHTAEFHRLVKAVHDFVDYFVQLALKQNTTEKTPTDDEKYVFLRALAKETQDPTELRSQLLNILLAGRDTTASTLGWFFYVMADPQNAAIFRRLRAIILENFGTYSHPRDITFEAMKGCQYLQWCLNECLRLYPVVPFNVRTARKDTTLPTGGGPDSKSPIYVRKGTDIGYSVHTMHRRKHLWGDDAEIFKPDRWETRRPRWDYLPFNGGPRICIGQQFALTEIAYVVIRMIQRIDVIDGSEIGSVKHGLTLTNCPGEGVKVRLHFTA